jgi:hypothetical protein
MLPQELEMVAQARIQDWEKNLKQRALLMGVPRQTPYWRQWTGQLMVRAGNWLQCRGQRMAQRESQGGLELSFCNDLTIASASAQSSYSRPYAQG